MKTITGLLFCAILGGGTLLAKDDAPRGYEPISQFEEAKAEAIAKNRLLVVLVKGSDDGCPNCVAAVDNGEKAIGSGVVKVFARAEELNKSDSGALPGALQERAKKKFTSGAAVTFLVLKPDASELLAEATRKELQSDKKATAEFKREIAEHKKALK